MFLTRLYRLGTMGRGRQWLAAVVAILALVALGVTGWWRAASLRAQLDEARSQTRAQQEHADVRNEELQRTQLEVRQVEQNLEEARGRLQARGLKIRALQGCIGAVADQGAEGTQTVRFGFVQPNDGGYQLTFDEADWYVGEEATERARADGVIDSGDHIPNDYFIRNPVREQIPLAVARGAVVVTTTMDRHNIPAPKCITWGRFVTASVHSPKPWRSRIAESPYWLRIENGLVVRLLEQYLP